MKGFNQLATKISCLLLVMVLLCALAVGISSFVFYRGDSIDANAQRALAIADSVAALIDADAFTETLQQGEANDYWYTVKDILDDVKLRTDVKYLYVLDANYTDSMTYFAEGYNPATDVEEDTELGYQEPLVIDGEQTYADEMFEVLRTGTPLTTDAYDSGDFGTMVSGFSAIKADDGRVVGVVGIDLSLEEVMAATTNFGLRIVLIIVLFCLAAGVISVMYVRRSIGAPIAALTQVSDKMADGDMNVELNIDRRDEIGLLAGAFGRMVAHTKEQAALLGSLAEGNLDVQVVPRSPQDVMSQSIATLADNLNNMFGEIHTSSAQVSLGAEQIASGAQVLASGATQQAATLQEFSAAINDVLGQSEQNADKAVDAYQDTMKAGELMASSMESMNRLVRSMEEINESSENIARVIKVVDDIAFQTNILALNAAVEAARAGQHGKGFAVVADEVRNLASKSAAAAKETASLIEDSIQKVNTGGTVAEETKTALSSVSDISASNAIAMNEISEASRLQSNAIAEINRGITELSAVVQDNSATSEESAASAEEMSSQAQVLDSVVGRFRLRDAGHGQQSLPGQHLLPGG